MSDAPARSIVHLTGSACVCPDSIGPASGRVEVPSCGTCEAENAAGFARGTGPIKFDLFARVTRKDKSAGPPLLPTAAFGAGYLLAWGGFGALATALQWRLESLRLLSPMLETTHAWLGASILIAAGVRQLTPLKSVCLRHCRSPRGFLLANWRPGSVGALRMGLRHGVYCLGCCWFLMTLRFFGGVMNLYWIVGLAGLVLLEKTIPHGHWLARAAGIALLAWGVALAWQSSAP